MLYSAVSYIMLRARLRDAVKKTDNIYESGKIPSPFVFGIYKPRIYIPFGMSDDEYDCVIEHEKCHLRRHDNVIKVAAYMILAVHWFNPLCYIAFHLMNKDMEMSCDETVLKKRNGTEYSSVLLAMATKKRCPYPLYFGETGVKSRVKNALKYREPKKYARIISAALCTAVVCACAANPVPVKKSAVQNLYDSRINYVGDASGVGNLIRLTMPEWYSAASKGIMKLKTDNEPYGLTIYLTSENFDAEVLKKQAYLLFALIENVGIIEYNVSGNELQLTREEADSAVGEPISDFAESAEKFAQLYEMTRLKCTGRTDIKF